MAQGSADRDRNDWGEIMIRCGLAFGVFLLLGGATVAALFWITSSFESASEALRSSLASSENVDAAVRASLDEARGHLLGCTIWSFLVGWLASAVFLASAQLYYPATDAEAAKRFGPWLMLLIFTCVAGAVIWWTTVSLKQVGAVLVYSNYIYALFFGFVCLVVAYWLATATVVKRAVKWSVPLARALPSLRN